MTIIADRIKEFAEEIGISLRKLEATIGGSNGLISGAVIRRTDIGSKWVAAIIDNWPTLNPIWLISGTGRMFLDEQSPPNKRESSYKKGELRHAIPTALPSKSFEGTIGAQAIPFYNVRARAGILSQIHEQHQNPIDYIYLPNMPKCDGAISVFGDSMHPTIKSGNIIGFMFIQDIPQIRWGKIYIVDFTLHGEDCLAVKRIHRSEMGEEYIKLVSDNQQYPPEDILCSEVRKIAIVKLYCAEDPNI